MKTILARNDSEKPVFLPRNFRLGSLIDIEYNNGFLVLNIDIIDLAAYFPKNPIVKIPQLPYEDSEIETKYYTGAIIYRDQETTEMFSNLLDKFPENLFNNIRFVDLLEDHWIKINLRPN
jgi:hypothetical protein